MEWPLLADLEPEDVRQLLAIARRRTFGKGDIVFHRDDPADSLHLIVRGRFAARVATREGDSVLLDVLGSADGDFYLDLCEHRERWLKPLGSLPQTVIHGDLRPDPITVTAKGNAIFLIFWGMVRPLSPPRLGSALAADPGGICQHGRPIPCPQDVHLDDEPVGPLRRRQTPARSG